MGSPVNHAITIAVDKIFLCSIPQTAEATLSVRMERVRLTISTESADSRCFVVCRNSSVCGAGCKGVTMLIVRTSVKFRFFMQNVERDLMRSIGYSSWFFD